MVYIGRVGDLGGARPWRQSTPAMWYIQLDACMSWVQSRRLHMYFIAWFSQCPSRNIPHVWQAVACKVFFIIVMLGHSKHHKSMYAQLIAGSDTIEYKQQLSTPWSAACMPWAPLFVSDFVAAAETASLGEHMGFGALGYAGQ